MKKLLIIEDDIELSGSISEFLTEHGFEVEIKHSGESGIEYLLQNAIDLVVCDLNIPGMDGYQILETIRSIRKLEDIPFLFLTGAADEKSRRTGMIKGADDYICKPFKFAQLLGSINSAIQKNTRRKEHVQALMSQIQASSNKVDQVNHISNHMIRSNLANVTLALDLLKEKKMNVEEALDILYSSVGKIDQFTFDINQIVHQKGQQKVREYDMSTINFNNVMLVDDDPIQLMLNKMVIQNTLGSETIATFENGLEAIDHLATHEVDIIFLDLNMPVISGIGFLEALKSTRKSIPIIMLSSSLDPQQINECYEYENVTQYLVKPLKPERLKVIL